MLEKYRLENRYTLREMAKMLKLTMPTYNCYEKKTRKVPLEVIIRFLEIRNEENDDKAINILKEFLDK